MVWASVRKYMDHNSGVVIFKFELLLHHKAYL